MTSAIPTCLCVAIKTCSHQEWGKEWASEHTPVYRPPLRRTSPTGTTPPTETCSHQGVGVHGTTTTSCLCIAMRHTRIKTVSLRPTPACLCVAMNRARTPGLGLLQQLRVTDTIETTSGWSVPSDVHHDHRAGRRRAAAPRRERERRRDERALEQQRAPSDRRRRPVALACPAVEPRAERPAAREVGAHRACESREMT